MTRLACGAVLVAALIAADGCTRDSAERAEQAAEEVTAQRDDLERPQRDIAEEQVELVEAESEFERTRALRIAVLRAEYEVIATQPMLISTMAKNFRLTDASRGEINEKLSVFQMRLDEAANFLLGLERADAEVWKERERAATKAMERLEEARKNAWDALDDAPKVDPSAS